MMRPAGEDPELPQGREMQARDLQPAFGEIGDEPVPRHDVGADDLAGIECLLALQVGGPAVASEYNMLFFAKAGVGASRGCV